MGTEEAETRRRAFLLELQALLAKYRVRIDSSEDYDGLENFSGRNYSFRIDGDYDNVVEVKDLEEELERLPPTPERMEAEAASWRTYTYGVPDAVEAMYPRAHLIDAAFRFGECDLEAIPAEHREGCLEMLAAGWVPDSLGKPGSPPVGIMKDPAKAAELRAVLEQMIAAEKPGSASKSSASQVM